jgi:hypothetical protein
MKFLVARTNWHVLQQQRLILRVIFLPARTIYPNART